MHEALTEVKNITGNILYQLPKQEEFHTYDSGPRKSIKVMETLRKAHLARNQINTYCHFNFSADSLNSQVIKDSFRLLTKRGRTIYMLSTASRLHRTKTIRDHVTNPDATSCLILFVALCSHVDHKQVKHSFARRML